MRKSIAVLLIALFAIVLAVSCTGEVKNALGQEEKVALVTFFDEATRDGVATATYNGVKGALNWEVSDYYWGFTTKDKTNGLTNDGDAVEEERQIVANDNVLIPTYGGDETVETFWAVGDVWEFTVNGYAMNGTKDGKVGSALFTGVKEVEMKENTVIDIDIELTEAGKDYFGACEGYVEFDMLHYDIGTTNVEEKYKNFNGLGRVILQFKEGEKTEYAVFEGTFAGGKLYMTTPGDYVGEGLGPNQEPTYYSAIGELNAATTTTGWTLQSYDQCPDEDWALSTEHKGISASEDAKKVGLLIQCKANDTGVTTWDDLIYKVDDQGKHTFSPFDKDIFIYHNVTTTLSATITGVGDLTKATVKKVIFNINMPSAVAKTEEPTD